MSANSSSQGDATAAGGGRLNTGHIQIATSTSGAIGSVNVSGAGSRVVQMLPGANLTVGSASGGAGALQVFAGSFTTGTGAFTVNPTGQVTVDGGTLNVLGDWSLSALSNLIFDDGVIDLQGGTFTPAFSFDYGAGIGADPLFKVTQGGQVMAQSDWAVGRAGGKSAQLAIGGSSSTWSGAPFGSDLTIGPSGGTGSLNVDNGGRVESRHGFIGKAGNGTAVVSGPGSTWDVDFQLFVGSGDGTGNLTIEDGAAIADNVAIVSDGASGSIGIVTVTGPGSTWTNRDQLTVGNLSVGIVSIENGGRVESVTGNVGAAPLSGTVTVTGAGSEWANSGSLFIGGTTSSAGGKGTLSIEAGATVSIGDTLKIWDQGAVNVLGGTIHFDADGYDRDPTGKLNFLAGTLELAGDRDVGLDPVIDEFFSAAPAITSGKGLTIEGAARLLTLVTLDGGTFTAGSLDNATLADLQRGTFHLTNQAVVVEPGGTFGDRLELRPELTVHVDQGTTNRGVITGNGELLGSVTNDSAGEVRAIGGHALTFHGDVVNNGQIALLGGLVEANQLVNGPAGRITGRGTLAVGGTGLLNQGHVALSNGITDILGDVTNDTGDAAIGVTVSGNADVSFWDDVTNASGLFRVAAGSSATFFGSFGGAGISGAGDVYLEADVTPGSSPASRVRRQHSPRTDGELAR